MQKINYLFMKFTEYEFYKINTKKNYQINQCYYRLIRIIMSVIFLFSIIECLLDMVSYFVFFFQIFLEILYFLC